MRRWHAVPVAALVAVAAGAMLFGSVSPREARALGGVTLEVDCDAGTAGIQTACNPANAGAVTDAAVVLVNESGAQIELGAFNFSLRNSDDTVITAPQGSGTLDNNPNFNEALSSNGASWACSPPVPDADDQNEDGTADVPVTNGNVGFDASFLSCFNASLTGPLLADGASIVLAVVDYTGLTNGITNLTLTVGVVGSPAADVLIDCSTDCVGAQVNVGGAAVPTATFTPTATATPTNTPIPCDEDCTATPTSTSLAYVTVTPTPGPETPTVPPGGETPAVPPTTGPGGGQPTAPGGGTGGSGGRPITLPDTGAGASGGTDWMQMSLLGLVALTLGGLAGGAYFAAATAARRRND